MELEIVQEKDYSKSREVSWKINEIPIYGTLTIPKDKAKAAIIFVAGSGPTDRDWCSPLIPGNNGSAKLLAEFLTNQKFMTLRYDKIASGPYVKENLPKMIGKISMQSHVDELSGAVKTVLSQSKDKKMKLFALTNSEGGIHALNYQLQTDDNKFDGLVLTGAPGRSIGEVARSQVYNQIASQPNSKILMKNYDDAVSDFIDGKPVVPDLALPDGVKQLLLGLKNPINLPFTQELWTYNPAEYISKVKEPILVIIGKKDIQVSWQDDGKAIENAASNKKNSTFIYPENANHVLKNEEEPLEKIFSNAVNRYNASDRIMDQETTNAILKWLNEQISR
jgi:alpha-beta hydrolase superfamily lysophospholipase